MKPSVWPWIVAAGAIALVAAIGIGSAHRAAVGQAEAEATRVAGRTALEIDFRVRTILRDTVVVANRVIAAGNAGFVENAPPPVGASSIRFITSVADEPEALVLTAGRARDEAATLITEAGPDQSLFGVVPVFTAGTGLARDANVSTTAGRRAAIEGWLVVTIEADALLQPGGPPVAIRDGGVLLVGEPVDPASPEFEILLPGRTWSVATPQASTPALTGSGWWALAASATALAVVVTAAVVQARRHRLELEAATGDRSQIDVVRSLAPVVQQSLDLAEVAPTLAVLLMDQFEFRGLSLQTTGGDGRSYDLFSAGTLPAEDAPPAGRLPEALEPGEQMTLFMQRGGRAIASLRVCAGRRLRAGEIESIQAACELTTAALINARQYEEQQQTVAQLRALDELKTVFLGTASHELRTPVTAINGFALLLDQRWDDLPDSERRFFASRIAANTRSLDSLVQDLLDFSRLERGRLVVSIEEFRLDEAITSMLDRLAPAWPTHVLERDVRAGPIVRADRSGLDRVVSNLVSNAVKFSPEGSTVELWVDQVDGFGEVVVDDAGPGVPVEDREQIFASFYRGSGSDVVRTRGAGIGLSVAKQYVDQMGGTISVGDSPAGGARFTVRLRLASNARSSERSHGVDDP